MLIGSVSVSFRNHIFCIRAEQCHIFAPNWSDGDFSPQIFFFQRIPARTLGFYLVFGTDGPFTTLFQYGM